MQLTRGALLRAAVATLIAPSPSLLPSPALALNEGALSATCAGFGRCSPRWLTLLALAGALGATCAGFGCNDYRGQDFPGLTNAAPGSMPYSDFLAAVKEKRILGVDFKGPNGDEAYALVQEPAEGAGSKGCKSYDPNTPVVENVCRLRMGEGWPVEVRRGARSGSSPARDEAPRVLAVRRTTRATRRRRGWCES